MAWQDEMVDIVRTMVDDVAATRYTDDRLEEVITVAARLVTFDADFSATYAIDRSNLTIAPDPTDAATRDDPFIDLVTVRSAAILDQGKASIAAGQAILVQDGASKIDLRDAFKAALSLLQKGWAAVYQKMLEDYITGQQGGVTLGAIITTPFRLYCRGGSRGDFFGGRG